MPHDTDAAARELAHALTDFSMRRGRPAVVVHGLIDGSIGDQVRERVRELKPTAVLDVIVTSQGGTATGALRAMRLLRRAADTVTAFVPWRARSAGTLFCLGANRLVVSPTAEFGPLDPITSGSVEGGPTTAISASDVRAFARVASDWFEIAGRGVELLAMLSQHVSPVALAQMYRSESLVRRVARAMLPHNMPNATAAEIDALVDQLTTGYESHDYPITGDELRRLGVTVSDAEPKEMQSAMDVVDAARHLVEATRQEGAELVSIVEACAEPQFAVQLAAQGSPLRRPNPKLTELGAV
jgi:hypothetical protein